MHDRVESELRPEGTNRLRHWLAMVGAEGGKSGTLTVTGYPEIADRMSPEGSSGCVGMRTATQRSFVCWSSRRRCRPLHDAGARQQSRREHRLGSLVMGNSTMTTKPFFRRRVGGLGSDTGQRRGGKAEWRAVQLQKMSCTSRQPVRYRNLPPSSGLRAQSWRHRRRQDSDQGTSRHINSGSPNGP